MADVKLVIKIPEKVYNAVTHIEFDANLVTDEMRKSIANGTPLPKGHGRLVDVDALYDQYEYADYDFYKTLEYAPTIIEADKAESEDKHTEERTETHACDCETHGRTHACDCISRQDVLDLAENGKLISNGNYKSVCDAINGIPAVDRWIPCNERMPSPTQYKEEENE